MSAGWFVLRFLAASSCALKGPLMGKWYLSSKRAFWAEVYGSFYSSFLCQFLCQFYGKSHWNYGCVWQIRWESHLICESWSKEFIFIAPSRICYLWMIFLRLFFSQGNNLSSFHTAKSSINKESTSSITQVLQGEDSHPKQFHRFFQRINCCHGRNGVIWKKHQEV